MFTQYIPKDPLPHVLYAKNEEGVDWYEFSRSLDKSTPKILIDKDGYVCCMGLDAEGFPFPDNLSLVQVKKLPAGESALWKYESGKFIAYEKTQKYKDAVAKSEYRLEMESAKSIIDSLRIEKEYSELSEEKAEQLKQAARDYISAKTSLESLSDTGK